MTIKTRVAPSPTGFVHLGFLRTALFDYLFAKKNKGIFMVRIEDTDQGRFVEGSIEAIIKMFERTGIMPDEGPSPYQDLGNGPYIQSERLDIYKKYIDKLIEEGSAYYCFCSAERLTEVRQQQTELKLPTKYDEFCRNIPLEDAKKRVENGEKYVVRLKIPKGEKLVFHDLVKGKVEFMTSEIEDTVLLKSDGFPTYHGAVIIDDFLMKVTHVFRGEEWLPSMPKQILTARALGIELPYYAHLPNVLGIDRKKLSKRTGDVAVENYLKKGYLVEALINYLAFLGWNPKTTEEFFTLDKLVERFDIADVHKAGAVFDVEKLNWMNAKYIQKTEINELYTKLVAYLKEYESDFYADVFVRHSREYNLAILKELQTRLIKFDDFIGLTGYFYKEAKLRLDLLINEKMGITGLDFAKNSLQIALDILNETKVLELDNLKNSFIEKIKSNSLKNGQVLRPVRVALSGEEFSPGAFELIMIFGIDESIQRIKKVIEHI
ncbi:glutamate--tRNA ligase [Candidatus Gracilibacteria bacterium]|nr:glutamate--tRNA ligase [Candidatus Gracilibacteria bacterium]